MNPEHFKSFRIGKLYYKYIKHTPLDPEGWTAEKLADLLEANGYIKILRGVQWQHANGQWTCKHDRYVEVTAKQISRKELLRTLMTHGKIVPPDLIQRIKNFLDL